MQVDVVCRSIVVIVAVFVVVIYFVDCLFQVLRGSHKVTVVIDPDGRCGSVVVIVVKW